MRERIVQSAEMKVLSAFAGPQFRGNPRARFVSLNRLRRLKGSEQVAAICYRVRNRELELLLVRTRGGRWIFPKGSAEPGITHAQAAALEAFEEAGVHGRMQESPFTRYIRRNSGAPDVTVHAHLCEVTWLDVPPEPDREPTWFSLKKAKRALSQGRRNDFADDLARVLEYAAERIRGIRQQGPTTIDAGGKVFCIEADKNLGKAVGQKKRFAP